jgi:hypothetical protein
MLYLKHGGHVVRADAKGAHDAEAKLGVRLEKTLPVGTPFDYLLPQLKTKPEAHLPGDPTKVAGDLKALGAAMTDDAPAAQTDPAVEVNSNIPAVYTYWGQFIDHDMTANTDRDSATSDITRTPLTPIPPPMSLPACATCAGRRSTSTTSTATARAWTPTTITPTPARRTRASSTASACAWAPTPTSPGSPA